MGTKVVLFDFDNTIASTDSVKEIRESGEYELLTSETLGKVRLYKPVPDLLLALRKQQVKLGLVTNSGAGYISRLLDYLQLTKTFDAIVTYADVKAEGKKPSPKGIRLALQKLGVRASPKILYVGDENTDLIAAYHAGITPITPTWASRKPVSMAPAIEMSSDMLIDYVQNPDEYRLFAERCAELGTAEFERKAVYFLPLDRSANVVTVSEQMGSFCLGRYFSQKTAVTAVLHDKHELSKEIARKEEQVPFNIPDYWTDLLAHVVRHGAAFKYAGKADFDIVTVIPAKYGKDPRLERLLETIESKFEESEGAPEFVGDIFCFDDDAKSQKTLHRNERYLEAQRTLHLTKSGAQLVTDKRVLVIDDVVTTGATLARALDLLAGENALSAVGLALAKTVSIMEDERTCPDCGRAMRVRRNKGTGERFWGCTGYYDEDDQCTHSEPLITKACPRCKRPMALRTNSRTGEKFWGCTGYQKDPACSYSENYDPSEMPN